MAKKILKRGGYLEKFDIEKIKKSIMSILNKLNFEQNKNEEILNKILERVRNLYKEIDFLSTAEIEAIILSEFEEILPEAVDLWRNFKFRKTKNNKI